MVLGVASPNGVAQVGGDGVATVTKAAGIGRCPGGIEVLCLQEWGWLRSHPPSRRMFHVLGQLNKGGTTGESLVPVDRKVADEGLFLFHR